MLHRLAVLFAFVLLPLLPAQERTATVKLDDGRVLEGRVIAMDMTTLKIAVGEEVHTLDARKIRVTFHDGGTFANEGPVAAATADPAPQGEAPPTAVRPPAPPGDDLAPDTDAAAQPIDVRGKSLLRQRLEILDERYPWLAPTAPTQWISLGLLLFVFTSVVVQLSTKVSGSDVATIARSTGVATWYLATALLQVAFVPAADVSTVVMLAGNTAAALYLMREVFGLTRGIAVVAFAVQLGFALLGYGVLHLVDATLRSVGTTAV